MSTMTLEHVRDEMRRLSTIPDGPLAMWADAIDAHLAQPAQAVDVEAIREVVAAIERIIEDECVLARIQVPLLHASDKLARALTGEKAGPVDDGDVAHFVEEAAKIISGATFPSGRSLFKARQIADLMLALPASPAPDKEGFLKLPNGGYHTKAGSTMRISGKYSGISRVEFDWCAEENACCDCRPSAYEDDGQLVWECDYCGGGRADLIPDMPEETP